MQILRFVFLDSFVCFYLSNFSRGIKDTGIQLYIEKFFKLHNTLIFTQGGNFALTTYQMAFLVAYHGSAQPSIHPVNNAPTYVPNTTIQCRELRLTAQSLQTAPSTIHIESLDNNYVYPVLPSSNSALRLSLSKT